MWAELIRKTNNEQDSKVFWREINRMIGQQGEKKNNENIKDSNGRPLNMKQILLKQN